MEHAGTSGNELFSDLAGDHDFHPSRRDAGALAAALKRRHVDRIVAELVVPARPARHAGFPPGLDPCLVGALRERGILQPYSHQRECWDHVAAGRDVVVVTPTASGKTLCYNVPVLQAALSGQSKALYLFPTKALSQDQVAEILELNAAGNLGVRAMTFDGDTPGDARRAVRAHGDIVVSNPDMLHQAILPHHTKWAQFFENLRDESDEEVEPKAGTGTWRGGRAARKNPHLVRGHGGDGLELVHIGGRHGGRARSGVAPVRRAADRASARRSRDRGWSGWGPATWAWSFGRAGREAFGLADPAKDRLRDHLPNGDALWIVPVFPN
jgi:DEAD/DEAH box helicase domain-containing protein